MAGEDTVSAFQFKETKKNTAETVHTLLDREDVMRFVVISSSVAAILLLGLILILAKHFKAAGRSRRRKRIQKEGEGDEEA